MRDKLETGKQILTTTVNTTVGKILLGFASVSLAFFLIGWMLFGWVIAPVQWQYPEPKPYMNGISFQSKATYVLLLSEWYAYSDNGQKLQYFSQQVDDLDFVACELAKQSPDMAQKARLITIAYMRNGYGCNQETTDR